MTVSKSRLADLLAAYAHQGQTDKAGRDYILHPRAVAARMETEEEKTVALLHDVLEDTFVTEATLRNLFGDAVTDAVVTLTHREGEDYEAYIRRIGDHPLALRVKLADLRHNMDLTRLPEVTEADLRRAEKYRRSYDWLRSRLPSSNG